MDKLLVISQKKMVALIEERGRQYAEKLNSEYAQEILDNQADMATLQNQINPHFLYNSLECIRGQALLYDVPEIADTTQALSKFFRYSINTKSNIVTLKDELENVKNYMKIQQYRFKERFNLDIFHEEADKEVLSALLPKLTLQPIVENAIAHGFIEKTSECNIGIYIIMNARHITIQIVDNGKGMTAAQLKTLYQQLNNPTKMNNRRSEKHNGIAMDNVNRRLKLLFGEEYGMIISSVEDMGTTVEIHVPLRLA